MPAAKDRACADAPRVTARGIRAELQRKLTYIRPYGEDDWDWTWADEGMEFLESGDVGMAELKFQELIAAQPEHPDGYEGLALVCELRGDLERAVVLIDEAVRLAQALLARDHVDRHVLEAIAASQSRIRIAFEEAQLKSGLPGS
jgi:Flp pilus assembly protein TadD